jgi:lambda family phage portal protein
MSAQVRPWYASDRVAVPTGAVVPDLTVKRSLVLDQWNRQRQVARTTATQRERLQTQARAYDGASVSRLNSDWWASGTSADSELLTTLRLLRNRSRDLVRNNPYARHAVRLIVNNVIGSGMGLQAQVVNARGKLQTNVNDSIEQAWADWCSESTCHTAGILPFSLMERLIMAQLVTAGEAIVRLVRQPFGGGKIPLALEVIEVDRLMDQWQTARAPNGNAIRMGVEVDDWGRPVAYWFLPRHPGDYQFTTFDPSKYLRVPAEDIIHLYVVERWPQTRGEPWFASTLRTLHDVQGYEEAAIVKARASANIVGFIKTPDALAPDAKVAGRSILETEPGTWQTLMPGEEVAGFAGAAPSPELDPFLRHMVRKHAVGVGVSYEASSRDYTGATYSSMRVGMLDDRDQYRVMQGFMGLKLRRRIHTAWMDAAALVGAIKVGDDYFSNPTKYQAMRIKGRGWSWIDPQKEVNAYKLAVRNGFMTQGDVVSQTSPDKDIEDVMRERREELDMAADMKLVFDSDPAQVDQKGAVQTSAAAPADDGVSSTDGPMSEEGGPDDSADGAGDGSQDNTDSESDQ